MLWWFVVFCLLLPVQVGVLLRIARIERETRRNLAALQQETAKLEGIAAAMEQVTVLQLALWRIARSHSLANHLRLMLSQP